MRVVDRAVLIGVAGTLAACAAGGSAPDAGEWTDRFATEAVEWRSSGRNPYFILEPWYQLLLADGGDTLTITVLPEKRVVDGVETSVVEERESEDGALVEVSRNFFAIDARTNGVFYFGEEVDIYENGRITGHEGAWSSGVAGSRFGLMMPGLPLLGARYYQEIAPGVAMDRARIVSIDDSLATVAGKFSGVLRVEETTPLEPAARESKYYGAGVGLLKDGSLTLVRAGVVAGRGR